MASKFSEWFKSVDLNGLPERELVAQGWNGALDMLARHIVRNSGDGPDGEFLTSSEGMRFLQLLLDHAAT